MNTAIRTLCHANLRRKKLQNLFVVLLIFASTLLISISVTVISNTGNVFNRIHDKSNGSHMILTLENQLHDPAIIDKWWRSQKGVSTTSMQRYRTLSGIHYLGKNDTNVYTMMMDTPMEQQQVDRLIHVKGADTDLPEPGSIWIATSLAYSKGIDVGDSIQFSVDGEALSLKVSSLVIDLPYGAPFSNTSRVWMHPNDYQRYIESMSGFESYLLGLRFAEPEQQEEYWNRFEEALGSPYMESKKSMDSISSFYLIMGKIIGFVMMFLGAVMVLIALFTITFTISDAIYENYRTIGILKSLGLTSSRIMLTYMLQYAVLAFIAILPGLLVSGGLSELIIDSLMSYLSTDDISNQSNSSTVLIMLGMIQFGIVLLFVWIFSRRTRSVVPVQAIRYGMPEVKRSNSGRYEAGTEANYKLRMDFLPVQLSIGLRNLIKHANSSVLICVLSIMTTAVLVFGAVLFHSILSIKQKTAQWGYDSSHIAMIVYNENALDREQFKQDITNDPRVKHVGWESTLNGVIPASESPHGKSMNIYVNVLDGSYEELGFGNLEGHHPQLRNEIAIGVNVARTLDKELGDLVEIYLNGNKHSLVITGIYQAIANMSNSARIPIEVVQAADPTYDRWEGGFINLHDASLAKQAAEEWNSHYKNAVNVVTQEALLSDVFTFSIAVLILPISLLGAVFVLITWMIIYSMCRINIRKESRTYGIYKSLGMSSNRLRRSITFSVVQLCAFGALAGAAAGIYVMPRLLENVLSQYGIVSLPVVIHWGFVIAAVAVSLLFAGIGSWNASRIVRKTSPRVLIVE